MKPATTYETNEQYHADTSCVSASMLKALNESPRIYEGKYITNEISREPSAAMQLGSAVHCLALEPETFDDQYQVCPEDCSDKRTKKYKDWAKTADDTKEILKHQQVVDAHRCVTSLKANKIIGLVLGSDGLIEQSERWTCEQTGIRCKMRLDKICVEQQVIMDLKKTSSLTEREFASQVVKFGYYIQAAHYLEGARVTFGGDNWRFVFGVVEESAPFRSRAFELEQPALEMGRDDRERLLVDYARRMESGDWSEPNERDLLTLELPHWFYRKG